VAEHRQLDGIVDQKNNEYRNENDHGKQDNADPVDNIIQIGNEGLWIQYIAYGNILQQVILDLVEGIRGSIFLFYLKINTGRQRVPVEQGSPVFIPVLQVFLFSQVFCYI